MARCNHYACGDTVMYVHVPKDLEQGDDASGSLAKFLMVEAAASRWGSSVGKRKRMTTRRWWSREAYDQVAECACVNMVINRRIDMSHQSSIVQLCNTEMRYARHQNGRTKVAFPVALLLQLRSDACWQLYVQRTRKQVRES